MTRRMSHNSTKRARVPEIKCMTGWDRGLRALISASYVDLRVPPTLSSSQLYYRYVMVLCSALRAVSRLTRSRVGSQCCVRALYSTDHTNRFYTKKHEWVSVTENIGTVGISSYAQDALGEIVYVQLPDVGKEISSGEECGALESVKAASEVYSPVSGTVTEKNTAAESTPALINKSCYGEGWLFRVKLSSPDQIRELLDQAAYEKYLQEDH